MTVKPEQRQRSQLGHVTIFNATIAERNNESTEA